VGLVAAGADVAPSRARPGDVVLLSGEIAVHGIAILSVREGLAFETDLSSDSASLHGLVEAVIRRGGDGVHVLRDPTRGGVASALNEIADVSRTGIVLDEAAIPVRDDVRGACEILGLDPLYVANEGKCLAVVAPDLADAVLDAMRSDPRGRDARIVGSVTADHPGQVRLRGLAGGWRVVDMMSGEQLPRIC
jgi:hydrogenase expression/formation protein HypE